MESNKNNIKIIVSEDDSLFSICKKLKDNGIKCQINEVFAGMYIKLEKDLEDGCNVICSNSLADDNADPLNSKFKFDKL